ncbi:MAG: protein-glutamine glutaminase family protein, partial [Bacteriovoracaceae bacterium]
HSVVRKAAEPKIWIVKLMDGRVGFWNEEEDNALSGESIASSVIDAKLSEHNELFDVRIIGSVETPELGSAEKSLTPPPYTATVYPTYSFATDVLNNMRRTWTPTSQCYDRAHVWVYDEFYWHHRYFQKVFVFFSDSYISRYNYPWWFHVAPYAMVKLKGEVVERVMDPAFAQYPLKFKLWTDLFMKNQAECKVVDKYSDYSGHPNEDDCYIIKASMYFWQPRDLENFEKSSVEKKNFFDWELKYAYEEGFGISM